MPSLVIKLVNLSLGIWTISMFYMLPVSLLPEDFIKSCEDTFQLHNVEGQIFGPMCKFSDDDCPFVIDYPSPDGSQQLDLGNTSTVKLYLRAASAYLQSLSSNSKGTFIDTIDFHSPLYSILTPFWLKCMTECTFKFQIFNGYNKSKIFMKRHTRETLGNQFSSLANNSEYFNQLGMVLCQKDMPQECMLISTNFNKPLSTHIIPKFSSLKMCPCPRLRQAIDFLTMADIDNFDYIYKRKERSMALRNNRFCCGPLIPWDVLPNGVLVSNKTRKNNWLERIFGLWMAPSDSEEINEEGSGVEIVDIYGVRKDKGSEL